MTQELATKWRNLIELFKSSSSSRSDFCKSHQLKPSQFDYWFKKIGKDKVSISKISNFIPLKRVQNFTITLPNGMRLEFDSQTDPQWAANVIKNIGFTLC